MNMYVKERSFESVGGLEEHIQTLREMIIYPLMYRELFDSFGVQAPHGVLFYGPPGTGKTLMAGAVAAECSKCSHRKVAFYMRKGGDCLNKYVGESEKHLQNLFNQAYSTRPSIIFFDEIDGLVPTRSELQEQVHASVVSTLLALMDGLDTKSEVFVIGATNRLDMIDPALRRPGRFDRELYFPLPPLKSRLDILKIHMSNWKNKPSDEVLLKLAAACSGYCGADIQSLCSQAVMQSFNRSYPQVLDTSKKLHISLRNIHVTDEDLWEAKNKIVPSTQRIYDLPSRPLSRELEPLLKRTLDESLNQISKLCPFCFMYKSGMDILKNKTLSCPKFLLIGKMGQAHISHIAPAILHDFDHLPVVVMDLASINEDSGRGSDISSVIRKIEEARHNMPCIIYLRNITSWWNVIDEPARQVLISSLESLDTSHNVKVFIFGSATAASYDYLPSEVKQVFPKKKCFEVSEPNLEERKNFFRQIIVERNLKPPKPLEPVKPVELDTTNYFMEREQEPTGRKRKFEDRNSKLEALPSGKLRNGKYFRVIYDDPDSSHMKRFKFESSTSCSSIGWNQLTIQAPIQSGVDRDVNNTLEEKKVPKVIVDLHKLEKLIDSAVKVTSKARISALLRLFEELEIVSLKYASKADRSLLPFDLEKEIYEFNPT